MTLTRLAPYDPGRVSTVGDHAVVVGGSVAGLLAARVLADAFERVTVVDRDPLPDEPVARRGVPQADHVHVLLEAGRATIADFLPGFCEAVTSAGGLCIDAATDLEFHQYGDFLAEGPAPLPMYCASRPLVEQVVRRLVAAREPVTLRGECRVTGYLADDATAVTGVSVRDGDGSRSDVPADLVVDATGRPSRTPNWLADHGYPAPPTDEVTVDLAYATAALERPPDCRGGYLVAPTAPETRGGTVVPVEGERWVVTLFGLHGDHPPTDPGGFRAFAGTLPTPAIRELLDENPWADRDIDRYPFPASLRRRYEDVAEFPEGLAVTGDAVASFNPVYGQGMSVAALDALALHHALAGGGARVGPRCFDRMAPVLDDVWTMTVGADFEFDATEGPKPRGTDLFNRYVARLVRTAHRDGAVADAFARVLRLERPATALLRPAVLWRVLLPAALADRRGSG